MVSLLTDCEYDHLTYSRPVGEVKPHYYTMASQLGRSTGDQSSSDKPTTSGTSTGATKKQRSPHSSSSSSNELNISRPEVTMDDYYARPAHNAGEVPKVSNLNATNDDEYAKLRENNLDMCGDSGKRGAYTKFQDDFNVTASTALDESDTNHNSVAETEVLSPDENI